MVQYMKAIRATLTTSQPVISEDDFQTMFFKIDELNGVHGKFLSELKEKQKKHPDSDIQVGDLFKNLADHIQLYGAFLHNYGRAIDTVKKCSSNNPQFKEIVSNIVLNSANEQSLTLEDLLHKPVARVQKNALVLQDLLHHTPESHPDYQPLKQAHKISRKFLSEFNVIQTKSFATVSYSDLLSSFTPFTVSFIILERRQGTQRGQSAPEAGEELVHRRAVRRPPKTPPPLPVQRRNRVRQIQRLRHVPL